MSLINREDLMQTLGITDMDCEKCGWYSRTARRCKRGSDFEDACCAIDDALEVEPEPQWIPCSERMPDELEEVNVTWVNHKPEPYYDFVKGKPFTASAVYYKGDWYWYSSVCTDLLAERGENEIDKIDDAIEITAWMPLPEPYKGETG